LHYHIDHSEKRETRTPNTYIPEIHTARQANATLFIYIDARTTTIQKLLGYKNVSTTQIYGGITQSTIIKNLTSSTNTEKEAKGNS
jgi:site-specific recombinase XerD